MNRATASVDTSGGEGLLGDYEPSSAAYDEMCGPDRAAHPHCQRLVRLLDGLGSRELQRRWEQARGLIREDGAAYNVHDESDRQRRWEPDPLPVLIPAGEWSVLSAGLVQRARLLDALLADLYGPQRVLGRGLLPAELVFGHANFLRPCHGWQQPSGRYLHLAAADLVRRADGNWCVVADHAQAPVGSGYAVENRIVVSRMIPHAFHDCQVQRLAGFFMALRDTLRSLAPQYRTSPRIVLLSPGPTSPTYFEDAYLARYLGYTLVEGEDLTVRNHRVFLKTLGGLIGVDVVLRRVADRDCDPLELEPASRLGVAGLAHAARLGHVAIANALGSGLVESPALLAYLPALARHLLGEELRLASVGTYWCGDANARQHVLAHLDKLLVRPALDERAFRPIDGRTLDPKQRTALAERIRAQGAAYVGQELLAGSTAPVWNDGLPRAARVTLRAFAVAAGQTYQALPGALAQATSLPGESSAVQRSKDVWVLAEGPVVPLSLLEPPGTPVAPRRSGNDLPSRVADNLFWLGRHVERAEGTARLLRSIAARLVGESTPDAPSVLNVLFRALTWHDRAAAEAHAANGDVTELKVVTFLFSHENSSGLPTVLAQLRRVASIVRDRISLESWRILNHLDDDFVPGYPLGVVSLADVLSMLNRMLLNLSAFSGVAMENMTRGPGWQFLDLGRRIERALNIMSLLRGTLFRPTPNEHAVLDALLEIADSSMTYRSRYATNLQLAPLLDLLITDETNPRSIGFQLAALAALVEQLPRTQSEPLLSAEQRLMLALTSAVRLANVEILSAPTGDGVRWPLDQFLLDASAKLHELSNVVSHKYLVHGGPPRQMAEIHPAS